MNAEPHFCPSGDTTKIGLSRLRIGTKEKPRIFRKATSRVSVNFDELGVSGVFSWSCPENTIFLVVSGPPIENAKEMKKNGTIHSCVLFGGFASSSSSFCYYSSFLLLRCSFSAPFFFLHLILLYICHFSSFIFFLFIPLSFFVRLFFFFKN